MKKMNKRIRQTRHLRLFIFSIFFINPHSPHQRRKPGSKHRGRARGSPFAESADWRKVRNVRKVHRSRVPESALSALSASPHFPHQRRKPGSEYRGCAGRSPLFLRGWHSYANSARPFGSWLIHSSGQYRLSCGRDAILTGWQG